MTLAKTIKTPLTYILLLLTAIVGLAASAAPVQADTLEFWAATFSGEERYGTATIYLQRTGGSAGAVDVTYATSNGTATAGAGGDYTAVTGTFSWADGDTSYKSFTVPIINDSTQEPTETVNLTLSNPTGGATLGAQKTAVLNIIDNDEPAVLEFWDDTFSGAELDGYATIYAQRTGGSGGAVTVQYATSNGTATAGADYTAATGTLSWADGDTSYKSFTVPITNDSTQESTETVNLTLSNPTGGATLGTQKTAVLSIVDNDQAAVLEFWDDTFSGAELDGYATIYAQRTGGSGGAVTVQYATSNGTATAGAGGDYTTATGTLSWADGDTAYKSFTVPITNDTLAEATETVNLTLSNPTGGAVLGTQKTAVLSITDNDQAAVLEFWDDIFTVNEADGTVTIYAQRTGGSGGAVTVQYATSNGTATAGSDYTAKTGTLSWGDGDTAYKSFTVPITNDGVIEGTETVNLTLSNPSVGAVLGTQKTAVLNITDNLAGAIQFSLTNYSVNENGTTATIYVERSGGSSGAVSAQYATSNGTATAGTDYTATSGTLFWAAGDTAAKSFTVPITNDALVEGSETVNLTLSNPSGGAAPGTPSSAVLTILEVAAGTIQFTLANYYVNENDGTATVWAKRTGGSSGAVSVHYATSDRIALASQDYTAASGTLSWANGDAADKSFTVPIINDTAVEGSEALNLTLSSVTGGATLGAQNTALLNILDDDSGVLQFSVANYSVNENGTTATITVKRSGGSGGAVSVQYATSNGTATAGSDYAAKSGTLSWAAGDATDKSFTVPITGDIVVEGNETVNLTLSNPTGGAILGAQTTALLTIVNDDAGVLQFSAPTYTVNENGVTATITVTRTGSGGAISVTYATSNGSTVNADYTPRSGTLSWASGDTTPKTFTVSITNDALVEGDETLNLTLSNPTNGAALGARSSAVLIIADNDTPAAGALQFGAAKFSVSESGVTATITVTRTGGSTGAISVAYATGNGTASSATDYDAASGALSWADGDTAPKTFTVSITSDTLTEGDETINLTLSGPSSGAVLGTQKTAVLTILDNDAGVLQFSAPTYTVTEGTVTITITVTRTAGTSGAVSVQYGTNNGTAIAGADFTNTSGTLSWANGNGNAKTFTVKITNDTVAETDEAFSVLLLSTTGGAILGTQKTAVLTIIDNDDVLGPTLKITAPANIATISGLTAITGTMTDTGSGNENLALTLFRISDGLYWNGTAWVAVTSPHMLLPTRSGTNWAISTGLPPLASLNNGNYIISAVGTDQNCNLGNAVVFITVNKGP